MSSIAILVPGKIHERVLAKLKDRFEIIAVERGDSLPLDAETAARIRGVAVSGGVSGAWMDQLPNLEVIASFGVGYDAIDVKHAASKGITVTNTPEVLNDEVADTAIGLLLNTIRELPKAEAWLQATGSPVFPTRCRASP
jgi:lactate dehydrogenase-like 2-hydroxyacid dehydrogenase